MRTNYQSLSLFRILIALYLGVDFFANILPWYSDLYTDQGILPRADLLEYHHGRWVPSLLLLNDSWLFHAVFCTIYVAGLLAFGLGYRTRAATVIVLAGVLSFNWRNYLVLSGAEVLVQLFLLWSLFLPMARYWSIDAALDPGRADRAYPKLPLYGIRVQISMLYLFSALYKIAGRPWLDGKALEIILPDNIYGGTITGLWLISHAAGLLPIMTWGATIFQFAFTPLIYCPWYNNLTRGVALLGAAAMHISFMFILSIGAFPYLCLIYLLVLVPDDWWNGWLARRRARLETISIYYDPNCGFCHKTALLFRSFCLAPASPVLPADAKAEILATLEAEQSWVVYTSSGEQLLHWRAVAYILRQSPVFWLFGWLSDRRFLQIPLRRLYGWIGNHRRSLGRLTEIFLPYRAEPVPGLFGKAIMVGLLGIALTYSLADLPRPAFKIVWVQTIGDYMPAKAPLWLSIVAAWSGVEQKWNLFAPIPSHVEERIVFEGTQADGHDIDLVPRWRPTPYEMAKNQYRVHFYNHRILKYFTRLRPVIEKNPAMITNYLCRKVNSNVTGPTYITNGRILYFQRSNLDKRPISLRPEIEEPFVCPPDSHP